ncbi:TIGR02186 family protein [Sphingopyxis sp. 113P3]|jgi:Putative transmembrane protein (Alph_Pro_TM).|uniref:TIGR02186 family protein n=1 Tax=Sphingopyxis sp. (strain 113P3) TaxID=292913 RepID=UPI0006AD2B20|nr:TIGR02186 family protein [Sphingopyxis sp. 113P3]ALC10987.1 transmembrane protein [Sphingopyxis sp. 113P3]
MTRAFALLLGLAAALLPLNAAQAADPRLVPDVSNRAIDIQYSFTGEELLLFGAILYPGQRLPDDRADIVVVLKGPVRPIVLREKQRVAGIWVNASSIRLRTSPGFYAIGSSRPIDKLVDERTAAIFELGLSNLSMSPTGFSEAKKLERFENGLIDLYRRLGLFYEDPSAVEIREGVLYRARIPVPARVPVGNYRAETYLISKGRVIAVASRDVEIRKAGFERFVALAAQRHGFLYGLTAVLLSLTLGYGASAIFRRR